MFNALRKRVNGYKLISGTGHGGHGWDFPNGIREMDMIMVRHGMLGAAEHEKRVEVILAFSNAFERENPDIDTSEMAPQQWAMASFILCHTAMRDSGGFGEACAIAAEYGLSHGQSATSIQWCSDWALEQMARRVLRNNRK